MDATWLNYRGLAQSGKGKGDENASGKGKRTGGKVVKTGEHSMSDRIAAVEDGLASQRFHMNAFKQMHNDIVERIDELDIRVRSRQMHNDMQALVERIDELEEAMVDLRGSISSLERPLTDAIRDLQYRMAVIEAADTVALEAADTIPDSDPYPTPRPLRSTVDSVPDTVH